MAKISENAPLIDGMIGDCAPMREVYALTRRAADSNTTVLLLGETGTGKELIARAVHNFSGRATGPFVRINCGALSESLLESELFGHVKGAFTSANENRTGRFEAAHGGTIFLDEINSISQTMQVKLLRVLQEQEFERVGDSRTIKVDCRIVAATNRDLDDLVEQGAFREDLHYRLNVIPIYLPPLRDRREDIPDLVSFFARMYAEKVQKARDERDAKLAHRASPSPPEVATPHVDANAMRALQLYGWPGNVRELQNYIERAVVLGSGDLITEDLLPPHVRGEAPIRWGRSTQRDLQSICTELVAHSLAGSSEDDAIHSDVVAQVEKELILQVLRQCHGVQTKTASRLGINRNTLHKKIDDYSLQDEAR